MEDLLTKPAKDAARELINEFYQPLGYLDCQVSSSRMWSYAKKLAIIMATTIIKTIPDGHGDISLGWRNILIEIQKQ